MGGVCLEKSVRVSSTPNLAVLKNPEKPIGPGGMYPSQSIGQPPHKDRLHRRAKRCRCGHLPPERCEGRNTSPEHSIAPVIAGVAGPVNAGGGNVQDASLMSRQEFWMATVRKRGWANLLRNSGLACSLQHTFPANFFSPSPVIS